MTADRTLCYISNNAESGICRSCLSYRYHRHDDLPSFWGIADRKRVHPTGEVLGDTLVGGIHASAGWSMPASSLSVTLSPSVGFSGPSVGSLRTLSASALASTIMAVLLIGIGCAVVTTTDPLWWHLHFSRLGEFRDRSGYFFNGTLITGGALIVVFARRVHADLRILGTHKKRRGAAHVNSTLITCVGVSLGSVGMIPLNVNSFLHDKAASGIVLSFAALLIASTVLLRGSIKRLGLANAAAFVLIAIAATFFVSGAINLALFEALGFSTIFGWVGVFTRCLGASIRVHHSQPAPAIASAPHTVPVRRPRRRVPSSSSRIASVRPAARRAPARTSSAPSVTGARRNYRVPSDLAAAGAGPSATRNANLIRSRRVALRSTGLRAARSLVSAEPSTASRGGSTRGHLIRQ